MTRYLQNLFVCQRFIRISVSIVYQKKRQSRHSLIITDNWCFLWRFGRLQFKQGKKKVSIVFDDMIADMEPNKKLSAIVTEDKNLTFHLFLYHNLISKCPKLQD